MDDYVRSLRARILDGEEPEPTVQHDIATGTGIMSLDLCLGGGLPSGMVEISGEESCGKTALLGHIMATAQQSGMEVALCISEPYDSYYMQDLGVDEDHLVTIRAKNFETMVELAAAFLKTSGRMVAIDSITGFRLRDETFGWWREVTDYLESLRDHVPLGSLVVGVSQMRAKRSADSRQYRGSESALRRGKVLFDVSLEVSRKEVKDDTYTMVVVVNQNILGHPSSWVELPAVKGGGVSVVRDIVRVALKTGVLKQRGPAIHLYDIFLGQGEEAAAQRLVQDQELWNKLMAKL